MSDTENEIFDIKSNEARELFEQEKFVEAYNIFLNLYKEGYVIPGFYIAQIIVRLKHPNEEAAYLNSYKLFGQVMDGIPKSAMAIDARAFRAKYKLMGVLPPDIDPEIDPFEKLEECAELCYAYNMDIAEYMFSGLVPCDGFSSALIITMPFIRGAKTWRTPLIR